MGLANSFITKHMKTLTAISKKTGRENWEDCLHSAIVAIYECEKRYKPDQPFKNFVLRTAKLAMLSVRSTVQPNTISLHTPLDEEGDATLLDSLVAMPQKEHEVIEKGLNRALAKLSDLEQGVVIGWANGRSKTKISKELEIPKKDVEFILNRGISKCRSVLEAIC